MGLTIDIADGAQLDHGVAGSTLVRVAFVTGLDNGVISDPSMLFRALAQAGLPQWYSLHPSNGTYILNRHVITPVSDGAVRITMYYVSGPAQPPTATWLVTESTTPYPATTQIHSKEGKVMTVWNKIDPNDQTTWASNVATFAYDISLLRLEFSGWVNRGQVPGANNAPPNTDQFNSAVNSVNLNDWRGYPPGYWRFLEWNDSTADRGYSYTVKAGFGTKIVEDWSQYEVFRDTNNGKIIAPQQADVDALKAEPYFYGFDNSRNLIIKAGNYPMIDFGALFGTGD